MVGPDVAANGEAVLSAEKALSGQYERREYGRLCGRRWALSATWSQLESLAAVGRPTMNKEAWILLIGKDHPIGEELWAMGEGWPDFTEGFAAGVWAAAGAVANGAEARAREIARATIRTW